MGSRKERKNLGKWCTVPAFHSEFSDKEGRKGGREKGRKWGEGGKKGGKEEENTPKKKKKKEKQTSVWSIHKK